MLAPIVGSIDFVDGALVGLNNLYVKRSTYIKMPSPTQAKIEAELATER